MDVSTVSFWVARSAGQRLDRFSFADDKRGRAWNRTEAAMEQRILQMRAYLREQSVLGEYGADAIERALHQERSAELVSRATINRVLKRHGATDAHGRVRRPAPPKGWYLPEVAAGRAEVDCFDFIEDLKIADGPLVGVLTGKSLHGALTDAWVLDKLSAKGSVPCLLRRWRCDGLPAYAQFDNDTVFQGAHQFPDTVGRISRLCLALGVIPVFVPPMEHGCKTSLKASMRCGKPRCGSVTTSMVQPSCKRVRMPTSPLTGLVAARRPMSPRRAGQCPSTSNSMWVSP